MLWLPRSMHPRELSREEKKAKKSCDYIVKTPITDMVNRKTVFSSSHLHRMMEQSLSSKHIHMLDCLSST